MFEVDSYTKDNATETWAVMDNLNNVFGKVTGGPKTSSATVKYLGEFETAAACWAACNASKAGECLDWTWHHTDYPQADWARQCYFTVGGEWSPSPDPGVTSARGPHSSGHFTFGRGGNQGGEGNQAAGEWFIENVAEELDAENEFWCKGVFIFPVFVFCVWFWW